MHSHRLSKPNNAFDRKEYRWLCCTFHAKKISDGSGIHKLTFDIQNVINVQSYVKIDVWHCVWMLAILTNQITNAHTHTHTWKNEPTLTNIQCENEMIVVFERGNKYCKFYKTLAPWFIRHESREHLKIAINKLLLKMQLSTAHYPLVVCML